MSGIRCNAQSDSSLIRIKNTNISVCIESYNEHVGLGMSLAGAGTLLSAIGVNKDGNTRHSFLFLGGAAGVLGFAFIIYAHFDLHKCKRLSIGPTSIAYKF